MNFKECTEYRDDPKYKAKLLSCLEKGYKFGFVTTTDTMEQSMSSKYYRYELYKGETFVFKSSTYYKMYRKMCTSLKINAQNG